MGLNLESFGFFIGNNDFFCIRYGFIFKMFRNRFVDECVSGIDA
jgi:hypothetical protein